MTEEVGFVKSVRGFLIKIEGLPSAHINDMVVSDNGIRGWVNALDKNDIEVLLIDKGDVRPGQLFKKLPESLEICVSTHMLGRVVNPLGEAIDGKKDLKKDGEKVSLEQEARGISGRKIISEQFITGITTIDTLIPLGKGQRELILGDARSGKTNFIFDVIANQKNTGVICVYAMIGKPVAEVSRQIEELSKNGALEYTVVVVSTSADPTPLIYLAPKTAMTIAQYFQGKGKDVLLILDDMGNHAKIFREISLLGDRSPGRESYPGDMFYQHAHLLERAGFFDPSMGSGSITALPVIEVDLNDFATLIPTNIMSMTDGHLLFRAVLSSQGQRPAVDASLSVSRVGRQTQKRVMDFLATRIRQVFSQSSQYETISRFSSELPPETIRILQQRQLIEEVLRQPPLTNIPMEIQTIMLGLVFTKFYEDHDREYVKKTRDKVIKAFNFDPQLKTLATQILELPDENALFAKLEEIVPRLENLITE